MAKNYSNRNRKRKALIAMLCALSVTCTGLAAACAPNDGEDEPSTAVTAKEDTQLLKNGNFEHFDIPDKAVHLIKNVNSWSLGGGTSVKSGIIGTSKSEWDKLTDGELAGKLDYNNDLSSDNDEYVNYNNMRSRDIPYKDTYSATLDKDKVDGSWITQHDDGYKGYFDIQGDEENGYTWNGEEAKLIDGEFYLKDGDGNFTKLIRKELIQNPGTHYDLNGDETKVTVDGKEYDVLKDEATGNLYYKDGDGNENYFGNVLMIHNAPTDTNNNGIQQYYTSNSISLEAHTSAEISVWVKTSDLRFDKGYLATAEQEDKGAYIEVLQTVAGKTVDSFKIKDINTPNILAQAAKDGVTTTESNGWVQYTVYVNACDFANTSIQLRLGLGGETENEKVTGYAFFDDVQVTKYRDLKAAGYDASKVENTTCTLTSEKDEKIFYTDVNTKWGKDLHYGDFHYLIDLASEKGMKDNYAPIAFGSNVEVGLTTEKDSKGNEYAAATKIDSSNTNVTVTKKEQTADYKLPKDVKARPTDEDIIKVLGESENFGKYSKLLDNVTGDNAAPKLLEENGNTLLMFSAWGAPYTATLKDDTKFTVAKDKYMLVSFWVKTSDMDGNTAATAKIYELDKDGLVDENSVKTITIDTTDKKTDFDKDNKDIYKGWVQCFFFVKNDLKDEDTAKKFQIDLSFGTTAITTATSFESGYAAFANLQVLEINEDIYNLASDGDTTKLFSFSKDTEKDGGSPFDEVRGTHDINKGIALPSSYEGANGANIQGSAVDKKPIAGLINKDAFEGENSAMTDEDKTAILKGFLNTADKWEDAFGDSYQPLIIINNLREYAEHAKADKDTYKNYWVKDGETYRKVAADEEYSEKETYYSLSKVSNYGFVGNDKTVSANGREVISVRVKVTGNAEAYIYLIDTEDTNKILNYSTPSYNFWYDEEGNVLDEEFDEDWTKAKHREHVVYTLREDGLYEDKEGNLYGNLYNLVKSYKDSKYERVQYYYADGKPVEGGYDYVEKHDGETFYKADGTIADHYLCSTDGTHVYEYKDGKYYYVEITKEDGKTTETTDFSNEIHNFDTDKAHLKYPVSNESKELYAKVTADDCNGKWITVNFVIKAGSEAKNYRLELWSGERGVTGVNEDGTYKTGAVAFDYVHGTVSENRLASYEKDVINAYNTAFNEYAPKVLESEKSLGKDANIADYEKALESLKTTDADKAAQIVSAMESYNYKASYYTYTLYDSAAYVPFNATTAGDGETGYNYDAASFSEQLAYFEFEDTAHGQKNIFVDYSAVDQSISKNTVDDEEEPEEEETANTAELGLYISSIVLVVVLLITLVSILITQYVRKKLKTSGKKCNDKNAYRKRDRYVKKLHLVKDEIVEPEVSGEPTEAPAEEVTPVENEVTEAPAEETVEPTTTEETTEKPEGEDKE